MLAHALLAVLPVTEPDAPYPSSIALVRLTCNEIIHHLNRLLIEPARRLINPLS